MWGTQDINMLMKLSYGWKNGKKWQCATRINRKVENSTSCKTELEAR